MKLQPATCARNAITRWHDDNLFAENAPEALARTWGCTLGDACRIVDRERIVRRPEPTEWR